VPVALMKGVTLYIAIRGPPPLEFKGNISIYSLHIFTSISVPSLLLNLLPRLSDLSTLSVPTSISQSRLDYPQEAQDDLNSTL